MKKRICVTRYGFTIVEAQTDEEAIAAVDSMKPSDFDWSSIDSDDAEVVEDVDE